jgi:transglutaminase-like putative cysteine protease
MSIEKLGAVFLSAAIGSKAFDERKPWWARIAYGAVAYDIAKTAFAQKPLFGLPEKVTKSSARRVPLRFKEFRVRTIQDRVALVHQQMIQGTRDPKIYALAREVLTRKCGDDWCVPEKDAKKEAEALFYEVQKRVRYTWDPTDYDAFQTPEKTLALRAGDCDDAVSLLGALLRSVGHKVRTRVVQTKGQTTWNHIYLLVNINGQWMPLDTTVKQPPGWEVPPELVVRKQDFDVVEGQAGPKLNT